MRHKSLTKLADDSNGCWLSVTNILGSVGEDMPDNERLAWMQAMRNLHSLAEEALRYADILAGFLEEGIEGE